MDFKKEMEQIRELNEIVIKNNLKIDLLHKDIMELVLNIRDLNHEIREDIREIKVQLKDHENRLLTLENNILRNNIEKLKNK